ncbi:hypothetical protein C8J56DRAFT_1169161 [Mycena floridula]|nr:hypothetical protein C8J56DRAFT_1169161 [Mycena floridula]
MSNAFGAGTSNAFGAGISNAFGAGINGAAGHKTLGSKFSLDEIGMRGGSNALSAPKSSSTALTGPPKDALEAVMLAYLMAEQEKARLDGGGSNAGVAAQGIVAPVTSPSSATKTSPPSQTPPPSNNSNKYE